MIRSNVNWALLRSRRTILAVVIGLALAVASLAQISSNLAERQRPDLAAAWWPGNDDALARLGELSLLLAQVQPEESGSGLTSTDTANIARARDTSLRSLRASGLQSRAFRVLAITALTKGNEREADDLATAAERLSRRDERIQLLLFRSALLNRDLTAGLRHFDLALRSNYRMREELFPMLANAMRDKFARGYFSPYFRADNPWLADFLVYGLNEGPSPVTIGELIAAARELPERPGTSIEAVAVPRMVQLGKPLLARTISQRLPPSQRPTAGGGLSNPKFIFDNQTILPFGWDYSQRPELIIRLPAPEADSGLQIHSTGSFGAELTRQLVTLRPGSYRLEVAGTKIDHARWVITCTGSGKTLVGEIGLGKHSFRVPSKNCEGQWLRLTADGEGPVDVKLSNVAIRPDSMPS